MSSWTSIKALRNIIKVELEKVFKKHETYTEETLNKNIHTDTLGEFLDLKAITKFTFNNSINELKILINNAMASITEKALGPILKIKYKLEIRQMKNDYLSLLNELPKSDYQSACVLNPSHEEKVLSLNGMKTSLSQTLNEGFCELLQSSREKLAELINYQIQTSFRKAMEEHTKFVIRFISNKTINIGPDIITLIDCQANALFLDLESTATMQVYEYIKVCIQYALDDNLKPASPKKFTTFARIEKLIKAKNYEEVFEIVLTMSHLFCLDYVCQHVRINDIFKYEGCILSYDTLLLLVETLGDSLCEKTYYKVLYLKKAVLCLDTIGLISKERVRFAIRNMLKHLEHLSERHTLYVSRNDIIELFVIVKTLFINCSQ